MFKKIASTVCVLALLAGCDERERINSVSDADRSDLAKLQAKADACAAGKTVNLDAGIQADLVAAIKGNVDFSATARQAIVGAIFEDADISDPNTLQAYKVYESCLRNVQF